MVVHLFDQRLLFRDRRGMVARMEGADRRHQTNLAAFGPASIADHKNSHIGVDRSINPDDEACGQVLHLLEPSPGDADRTVRFGGDSL